MRRFLDLTADDFEEMYRRQHLRPKTGQVEVYMGQCCAIGAAIADAGVRYRDTRPLGWSLRLSGYDIGDREAFRFAQGFDEGLRACSNLPADAPKNPFTRGYEIGQELRRRFDASERLP